MYEKMIQIDPNAPTEEEHQAKGKLVFFFMRANSNNTLFFIKTGVTKPRYMVRQ